MKEPIEHTYWGFEPQYIREPEYPDNLTVWFNTLQEAQEYRGKHNILAKMAKDDLKELGLPVNDYLLRREFPDRHSNYMELVNEWDNATLNIAKKLSIVAPDFDKVASYAACYIPQHVGSEFRSRHVSFTVDAIRELL